MVAIGNGIGVPFLKGGGGGAPAPSPDFISVWDTTKAGSASDTVVLPLLSGGTYNGTIDWGDGNTSALSYANRSHTYAAGGTYTITISGSDIQGFQFNNAGDKLKITDVSNWGNLTITTIRAFFGCSNLDVSATDAPTILTSDLTYTFYGTGLTTADLSKWDVSGVADFDGMFMLSNSFNGDVTTWDMSSATGIQQMFRGCSLFNQDISGWDLSGITGSFYDCRGVFHGASSFNQPIGNWNIAPQYTFDMFRGASSFNQDLSNWDMSNCIAPYDMFRDATSFNNGGSSNINNWDVSNVAIMGAMFRNTPFDHSLSNWDITSVTNFNNFMVSSTGLSTSNYDATLIGWEATLQAAYPSGVGYTPTINIHFGSSQYTLGGTAGVARTSLISIFGWTITDGGGI